MAYSQDLRERVIAAVRAKGQSLEKIAQTFVVSPATVDNWARGGERQVACRRCRGLAV